MPIIAAPTPRGDFGHFNESSPQRSRRDSDATGVQWQKNGQTTDQTRALQNAVSYLSRTAGRQRPRIIGMPMGQDFTQQDTVMPFAFYSVTPENNYAINNAGSGYVQDDIVTLSGGTLAEGGSRTQLKIAKVTTGTGMAWVIVSQQQGNYSTPPTYPNAVTGGSGTGLTVTAIGPNDAYRTVQMRDGIIGVRPRFSVLGYAPQDNQGLSNLPGMNNSRSSIGNYQMLLRVACDNELAFSLPEPSGNLEDETTANPIMLGANQTPVLITGYTNATTNEYVTYSQIIVNAPADGNTYYASFWLEIVDKSTGTHPFIWASLKGQMYDGTVAQQPFPESNFAGNNVNIIPIAALSCQSGGDGSPLLSQFLIGNLINLFDSYFNNDTSTSTGLAAGSKMWFRGDWTADNLSGQTFYPGDCVRSGQPNIPMAVTVKSLYVCLAYGQFTEDPATDNTNWLPLTY